MPADRGSAAGLLIAANAARLIVQRLDLRHSGDTAGNHARVVGYGAWAFSGAA
jgi:AmmeMemoRadiSam system protein B